jgi:hypothetical protein
MQGLGVASYEPAYVFRNTEDRGDLRVALGQARRQRLDLGCESCVAAARRASGSDNEPARLTPPAVSDPMPRMHDVAHKR